MNENGGYRPISYSDEDPVENEKAKARYEDAYVSFPMYIPNQSDVVTGLQGKIYYERAKSDIRIREQGMMMQQRFQLEQELLRMKEQYRQYLSLMETAVYADAHGNLMLAFKSHEGQLMVARQLLNVTDFSASLLYSVYPTLQSVLHIKWEGVENGIYISYSSEGISAASFLKRLKTKGVLLLVSGRTEKKAADALLAYAIMSASKIEIPPRYGWSKLSNGSWHFAWPSEQTMKGVLRSDE